MKRGRTKVEREPGTCGDCPVALVQGGTLRCPLRRAVVVLPQHRCLVSAAELRIVAGKLEEMSDGS